MSDPRAHSRQAPGPAAPHPVDAVLAALRAVPDAVLRPLEPATLYVPPTSGPGWVAADGHEHESGAAVGRAGAEAPGTPAGGTRLATPGTPTGGTPS